MPEISRFYGIRITMNYVEHLPPHFHASYGDDEAQILIATGQILKGSLSGRASNLVREWTIIHREELEANWRLREEMLPLNRIAPLP
ncbi:MAG: DUF4160 domain-containing protein [Opitutus sp.]|nr:DUF4160 domain-containing protein [Opitutus sp.]